MGRITLVLLYGIDDSDGVVLFAHTLTLVKYVEKISAHLTHEKREERLNWIFRNSEVWKKWGLTIG